MSKKNSPAQIRQAYTVLKRLRREARMAACAYCIIAICFALIPLRGFLTPAATDALLWMENSKYEHWMHAQTYQKWSERAHSEILAFANEKWGTIRKQLILSNSNSETLVLADSGEAE